MRAGGVGPPLPCAPISAPYRGRAGTGRARLLGWVGLRPATVSPCPPPRSLQRRRHPHSLAGARGADSGLGVAVEGLLGKGLRTRLERLWTLLPTVGG